MLRFVKQVLDSSNINQIISNYTFSKSEIQQLIANGGLSREEILQLIKNNTLSRDEINNLINGGLGDINNRITSIQNTTNNLLMQIENIKNIKGFRRYHLLYKSIVSESWFNSDEIFVQDRPVINNFNDYEFIMIMYARNALSLTVSDTESTVIDVGSGYSGLFINNKYTQRFHYITPLLKSTYSTISEHDYNYKFVINVNKQFMANGSPTFYITIARQFDKTTPPSNLNYSGGIVIYGITKKHFE